jgi:hypothetical protein
MSGKLWFGGDGAAAGLPANGDEDVQLEGRRHAPERATRSLG